MALDKTIITFGQIHLQFYKSIYYIFLNMTECILFVICHGKFDNKVNTVGSVPCTMVGQLEFKY